MNRMNQTTNSNPLNVKAMMALLLFGGFLSLFNETILNVALSSLMAEMQVSATTVQWLSTGYVLIVAIMVPTSAFLLHTFTTRQIYSGAMGFFLAGTVIAAAAGSFPVLLAGRMVQAVGTGLLAPIMINSALAIYPRKKHGFVMGVCTCVVLVGPSAGPIVSGVVLEFFSWRALFLMLIPLAALCIIGGLIFMGSTIEITKPQIDALSIILSSIGFSLLVYGMSIVGSDTGAITTLLVFAVGIAALALFAVRQLRLPEPMLDVRAFQKPYFTLGAVLVIVMQMVQFSLNIILPMLFEGRLGLSSLMSAVILFPAVLMCSVMTIVSGRLYDRIGGKTLIPLGLAVMCAFLIVISRTQPSTPVAVIAAINTLIYFGISLAWSPDQSNALRQLPPEGQTDGVAIVNTFIQLGSALGTPLFVRLMSAGQAKYLAAGQAAADTGVQVQALYGGFRYSMTVAAVIIAAAFLFSLTLKKEGRHMKKTAYTNEGEF